MFEKHYCEDEAQQPDFARYETEKAAWAKANPNATPVEYEQAMCALALAHRV
jgi:hypothetical protein